MLLRVTHNVLVLSKYCGYRGCLNKKGLYTGKHGALDINILHLEFGVSLLCFDAIIT